MSRWRATLTRRADVFFDRNGDGRRQRTEPIKRITTVPFNGYGPTESAAKADAYEHAPSLVRGPGWVFKAILPPIVKTKRVP